MRDYTKIKAWQLSDDLTVAIYRATAAFPREEQYALTSQLRRAAYSVPSNIAEGSARRTKKDYLHFLDVARASLAEVEYFVHLSGRLGYLSEEQRGPLSELVSETFRVFHGLIRSVEREVASA